MTVLNRHDLARARSEIIRTTIQTFIGLYVGALGYHWFNTPRRARRARTLFH